MDDIEVQLAKGYLPTVRRICCGGTDGDGRGEGRGAGREGERR